MQLSKIMAFLLGCIITLTPLQGLSATQEAKNEGIKTERVKKPIQKAGSNKSKSKKAQSPKSGQKKEVSKKVEAKWVKIKRAVRKNKAKKTNGKKIYPKSNAKTSNKTKQLYGVKGVVLQPTKVSNRRYTYSEKGKTYTSANKETSRLYSQTGVASYYGGKFHGRKTASGEIFNKNAYTAAHKTLALGSYALVTNLRNGRRVIVKINDRGPFSKDRIIDLSVAAAREIGMIHSGISRVKVEAMQVDRNGYITGKAAHTLYGIAKRTNLPLKVKGEGKNFAIKAEIRDH